MTMASGLYIPTWRDATDTTGLGLDMLSSSIIVCLYTDTKTPNFDTDSAHSAVNELASTGGYTQDSKTVGGTPTYALGSAGQLKYDWSTTVSWTSATFTARGMILGIPSTLEPIVAVTFGADYTATAGTFTIDADAAGIFYIDLVP